MKLIVHARLELDGDYSIAGLDGSIQYDMTDCGFGICMVGGVFESVLRDAGIEGTPEYLTLTLSDDDFEEATSWMHSRQDDPEEPEPLQMYVVNGMDTCLFYHPDKAYRSVFALEEVTFMGVEVGITEGA